MKHLVPATLLSLAAITACSAGDYVPTPSPNPWVDDYEPLSAMSSWRQWGTYNVHDPAVCRVGDYYYMYTTDAIYRENRREAHEQGVPLGFIQIRRSADLVNWEFLGWAFEKIPQEAVEWVRSCNHGHGAHNIWAPYMVDCKNGTYRLYYCVSAFGKNTSYIGLAEATDPAGPWQHKGCVVRTDSTSLMNAIDPTVIATADGGQLMYYGSYFGGIYRLALDPATGLALTPGDQGSVAARRANYRKDNLEAPEALYNPELGEYYLFGSYDPLMTTYNVRVCRSDSAEGPFIDFHGKQMRDTTDNFPLLTAPYRFDGHPGWVGTAHCGVFSTPDGRYFMAHQGRLASNAGLMVLHLRQMFFTPDGWPVVSPERYAATPARQFRAADLPGAWEIVRLCEPRSDRRLEAGQILFGEGDLIEGEWNVAKAYRLGGDGTIAEGKGAWAFDEAGQLLSLTIDGEEITNLIVHAGHDWEREADTVLFTGLDAQGRSVWGKRVE